MASGKSGKPMGNKKRSIPENLNEIYLNKNSQSSLQSVTKQNQKTQKILEFGNLGLWELDVEKNLFRATANTFRILGLKCPSLIKNFTELKAVITKKDDREKLEKCLLLVRKDGINMGIDFRIHSPSNAKKTMRMHVGKLDANTLGGTIKDITEVRKIEKELIRSKNKAEKADEFKSAFLTNFSHDLRTPMNAILGFTELMNQESLEKEQKADYARIIKNKANYLLSLIDDINELAKFETGQVQIRKTYFLLFPVFTELYNEFEKRRIESGKINSTITLNFPEELKTQKIYTDQGRLYQLMSILLSNAIRFTEKGRIEFGVKFSDACYKFYVEDTGIGMTEDEQGNVFNRFSKIEETSSGGYGRSGFSLTISKHIVKMLGGKIKVKSELNKGSRFQFVIPEESPGKTEESMITYIDDIKSINWKEKIILVAEDEELNYKFLETILHKTQAQILRARTGIEAVELCKKIPKINIVLMDIKMPVMNGYEATSEIKKIRPDLPVIAQTAFYTQEEIIKCKECGCIDYISKPIDIWELLQKINLYS